MTIEAVRQLYLFRDLETTFKVKTKHTGYFSYVLARTPASDTTKGYNSGVRRAYCGFSGVWVIYDRSHEQLIKSCDLLTACDTVYTPRNEYATHAHSAYTIITGGAVAPALRIC